MKKIMKIKRNRGMSYVELIVVLSIFSLMTSVVIFNYGDFQAKVDVKNYGTDIALKVVEAQKSALSGKFTVGAISDWKPAYGVCFNVNPVANNKSFVYFADLNNGETYNNDLACTSPCAGECLEKITITKGNYISLLDAYYPAGVIIPLNDLTVSFKRPNSGAIIKSSQISTPVSYVQITVSSANGHATSKIKIYPTGRIQVN